MLSIIRPVTNRSSVFRLFAFILFMDLTTCLVSWAQGGGDELSAKNIKTALDVNRYEWAVVPILSADSDIGVSFGSFFLLTKFQEGYRPHRWQMPLHFKISVKQGPNGVEVPTHEHYISFDLPGLWGGRLRLTPKIIYVREITAGYYGLGNASRYVDPGDGLDAARRYEYIRDQPGAQLLARYNLPKAFSVFSMIQYAYQRIDVYRGSKLLEDIDSGAVSIIGNGDNGLAQLTVGLAYDTRDHEVVPTRGVFADASIRGSDGNLTGAEHDYWGADLAVRAFLPVWDPYAILALRVQGDLLSGKVPFYQLSRAEGIEAIQAPAGKNAVRGIPAGRYSGKVKGLANAELRSMFYSFSITNHRFRLGSALFYDAGRVWADWRTNTTLDGRGPGIKWGTGGGARLQWGESLVIRADIAYSPDARQIDPGFPFGFYFEGGQSF